MNLQEIIRLRTGEWIDMKYGFERNIFYVVQNYPEHGIIILSSPEWLSTSLLPFTYDQFLYGRHDPKSWWRKTRKRFIIQFLLPPIIGELFCPFKLPPMYSLYNYCKNQQRKIEEYNNANKQSNTSK